MQSPQRCDGLGLSDDGPVVQDGERVSLSIYISIKGRSSAGMGGGTHKTSCGLAQGFENLYQALALTLDAEQTPTPLDPVVRNRTTSSRHDHCPVAARFCWRFAFSFSRFIHDLCEPPLQPLGPGGGGGT